MSRLNDISFTSNLPNSFKTDDGSAPTSSKNTRPNNSKHSLHLPRRKLGGKDPMARKSAGPDLHIVGALTLDSV